MSKKMFPLQTTRDCTDPRKEIPWQVAERAYLVYCARYGSRQTLERLAERAGFSCGEMDDFLPNWREESDKISGLEAQISSLHLKIAGKYGIEHLRRWNSKLREIVQEQEKEIKMLMGALENLQDDLRGGQ